MSTCTFLLVAAGPKRLLQGSRVENRPCKRDEGRHCLRTATTTKEAAVATSTCTSTGANRTGANRTGVGQPVQWVYTCEIKSAKTITAEDCQPYLLGRLAHSSRRHQPRSKTCRPRKRRLSCSSTRCPRTCCCIQRRHSRPGRSGHCSGNPGTPGHSLRSTAATQARMCGCQASQSSSTATSWVQDACMPWGRVRVRPLATVRSQGVASRKLL